MLKVSDDRLADDRRRPVARVRAGAAAIAAILLVAAAPAANAYSQQVNSACEGDYYRFCSAYAVESTQLRRCIEASRRSLTQRCIDALIAAGEVPRKYLRKR